MRSMVSLPCHELSSPLIAATDAEIYQNARREASADRSVARLEPTKYQALRAKYGLVHRTVRAFLLHQEGEMTASTGQQSINRLLREPLLLAPERSRAAKKANAPKLLIPNEHLRIGAPSSVPVIERLLSARSEVR